MSLISRIFKQRSKNRRRGEASKEPTMTRPLTFDLSTLPTLPEPRPRTLTLSTRTGDDQRGNKDLVQGITNPQLESAFFQKLPRDIRFQIYEYLFGRRTVYLALQPVSSAREGEPQWGWYYYLHNNPGSDEDEVYWREGCLGIADAATLRGNNQEPWRVHSVTEWLRTCRIGYSEAIRILYGSNTFSFPINYPGGKEVSSLKLFTSMPRLFPKSHLSLITSLQLTIRLSDIVKPPDNFQHPDFNALIHALTTSGTYTNLQTLKLAVRAWDLDLLCYSDPIKAAKTQYKSLYSPHTGNNNSLTYPKEQKLTISEETARAVRSLWFDPISEMICWRNEHCLDAMSVTMTIPSSLQDLFIGKGAQEVEQTGTQVPVEQDFFYRRDLDFKIKTCMDDWPQPEELGLRFGSLMLL